MCRLLSRVTGLNVLVLILLALKELCADGIGGIKVWC
jgi:hypothetical protein